MLIESNISHIDGLVRLWNNVFGDSEEYIKLLFGSDAERVKVFAVFEKNQIVSALYAFESTIGSLRGFYIYACATYPSCRGKGYMSSLISECIEYARNIGFDFVCLVPGEESLYNYYSGLGFQPLMHRSRSELTKSAEIHSIFKSITTQEFLSIKETHSIDAFLWHSDFYNYIERCLSFAGVFAYCSDDCALLYDSENSSVTDLVLLKDVIPQRLANEVCTNFDLKKITVFSDYFGLKDKYGMIYKISDKCDISSVYMNIAME